ncbi:MAG TPA: hypothetical protein PKW95_05295 [bacterium]|nr:hypothetical protein [bacterium]
MPDEPKLPAEQWTEVRRKLAEVLADPERLDEADRITKVWERLLKCERLARDLAAEEDEGMIIDVSIEGLP